MTSPERHLEEELIEKLRGLKHVLQLINGVPVTQIELKTLGINPRRAMERIVDYKNDPGNGYMPHIIIDIVAQPQSLTGYSSGIVAV
jgi:hypothetical protein